MTEPAKWMHDGTKTTEGEVLQLVFALVSATKPELCVETGTFAAHGTKAIARALEQNQRGELSTVEYETELYAQYKELDIPRTRFFRGDSLGFARNFEGPCQFAFVDCGEPDHRLEVAVELASKTDGLMVIHDTAFYPGFLDLLETALGPCALALPTLHGVAIWQFDYS